MSREEAKQNLVALGIEEPTDAQVTNYLNQFHANDPKPEPKTDPKPEPKTDPEGNSELEKAMQQIEQLKADITRKDIASYAAQKGLVGEQAESILSGLTNDLETAKKTIDSFFKFVTDKETAAAAAKENEIANGGTNPSGNGNGAGNPDGELSMGAKMAQQANARFVIE
nr:MAG TPA: Major head protein [Caudoviricetes sp.]